MKAEKKKKKKNLVGLSFVAIVLTRFVGCHCCCSAARDEKASSLSSSHFVEQDKEERCLEDNNTDRGSQYANSILTTTLAFQEELHSNQAAWDEEPQNFRNDTAARQLWQTVHAYMTETVLNDDDNKNDKNNKVYKKVRHVCKNKLESCTWHAAQGECTHNLYKHWMRIHCAPACQACHLLDHATRCPVNRTAPGFFQPGDLDRMFQRIVHEFANVYQPKVHSRPGGGGGGADPTTTVLDGPWIVTLDSFVSNEEATQLIQVAQKQGLQPSIGRILQNANGTYQRVPTEYRTSSSAYCHEECYHNTITKRFNDKLEHVLGTPHSHASFLHFLRYHPGEFYRQHSDYIRKHHKEQQHGVRVLTALVYLTDVPAGGETHFPLLDNNNNNLTIAPQRGRVLIFPNVLNDQPTREEKLTAHAALPVREGVKFAVSMYVHQKDYKTPFYEQCIR